MLLRTAGLLLCFTAGLLAQPTQRVGDHNLNGWYMYFGDHPIKGGPWEAHLEWQFRRHDAIMNWQQFMPRLGLNYKLTPNTWITGGYAFVNTYRYGEFPVPRTFPEHRIYQQLLFTHKSGRVDVQHRYRIEQRWIGERAPRESGIPDRWRYQNRVRYFGRGTIPLSRDPQYPWYLGVSNEIFVNIAPNVGESVFDQNRAYAAVGYRLSRYNRVEFGYLNQLLAQRNGRILEHNHTLQFGWFSNLPFGSRD